MANLAPKEPLTMSRQLLISPFWPRGVCRTFRCTGLGKEAMLPSWRRSERLLVTIERATVAPEMDAFDRP